MLKKAASGVLASLRGSTYRSVRLAYSLAAALLDGIFEHPARALLYMSERSFFLCRRNGGQLFIRREGWIKNQTRAIVPTYI